MRPSALFGFWGVSTYRPTLLQPLGFLHRFKKRKMAEEKKLSMLNAEVKPVKARDWFGYILTAVIGILVTVIATWYQLYASERQASAAELERSRAVRQSVISIIEELGLNGKRLEAERIARLIDQRRREQNVSIPISTADVAQQAEFNITSSSYLSVDRKEQIKPIFDALYADLASRSFQVFPTTTPNAALLNELAKEIQDGKTSSALANLRRLQELNAEAVSTLMRKARPTFLDAFMEFIRRPLHIAALAGAYLVVLRLVFVLRRRRITGYWRRPF